MSEVVSLLHSEDHILKTILFFFNKSEYSCKRVHMGHVYEMALKYQIPAKKKTKATYKIVFKSGFTDS